MPDHEPDITTAELAIPHRTDKVESPQQYPNLREYAFSDAPETERKRHL